MRQILCFVVCALLVGCQSSKESQKVSATKTTQKQATWRGIHLFVQSKEAADSLAREMPRIAAIGVNVIVVEVNYSFDFKSHPELRNRNYITKAQARKLAVVAKENG